MHIAEPERDRLRALAAELGGPSTLLHFDDAERRRHRDHPGPPRQPSAVHHRALHAPVEPLPRRGRRCATRAWPPSGSPRRTSSCAPRAASSRCNLAVGLASWRIGGLACTAPVLLRPLGIRRHHSDFELKLHGSFTVNPELVRALRTHFGIELDGAGARGTRVRGRRVQAPAGDRPHPRTDRVDRLVHRASAPGRLDVRRRRRRDGAGCRRPRPPRAQRARRSPRRPREPDDPPRGAASVASPDERAPASDTLLLDADAEQEARARPHHRGAFARRAHPARHRRHADRHQRGRRARARRQARARRERAPLDPRRRAPSPRPASACPGSPSRRATCSAT